MYWEKGKGNRWVCDIAKYLEVCRHCNMPLVVIWVCLCVVWLMGYGVIAMGLVGGVWCELKQNLKSVCLVAFGCCLVGWKGRQNEGLFNYNSITNSQYELNDSISGYTML